MNTPERMKLAKRLRKKAEQQARSKRVREELEAEAKRQGIPVWELLMQRGLL